MAADETDRTELHRRVLTHLILGAGEATEAADESGGDGDEQARARGADAADKATRRPRLGGRVSLAALRRVVRCHGCGSDDDDVFNGAGSRAAGGALGALHDAGAGASARRARRVRAHLPAGARVVAADAPRASTRGDGGDGDGDEEEADDDNGEVTLRELAWRLFLGCLPVCRAQWRATLAQQSAAYADACVRCERLTMSPSSACAPAGGGGSSSDPLTDAHSAWADYFAHRELLRAVELDVQRTHADFHRMHALRDGMRRVLVVYATHCATASSSPPSSSASASSVPTAAPRAMQSRPCLDSTDGSAHHLPQHPIYGRCEHGAPVGGAAVATVERDPSRYYRQGMNELLAPFLLCCASEAGAYTCFAALMQRISVVFESRSPAGVQRVLEEYTALLQCVDRALDTHVRQRLGVEPNLYALRWLRTLFAQDLALPDIAEMWDVLLAGVDNDVLLSAVRMAVAMACALRTHLMACRDTGSAVRVLQRCAEYVELRDILRAHEWVLRALGAAEQHAAE